MKKVKRRSRLIALLLAAVMLAWVPVKVQAAPPPTTTGVTQDNFDAKRYADTYADLKKAFGYNEALLWQHYQQFGIIEGRQAFAKGAAAPATVAKATAPAAPAATAGGLTQANFDAKRYADTYADLKKAFGYNESLLWQHYQQYGIKEGRQAYAKGATAPATATKATAPAVPATTAGGLTQANFDARRYADTYADLKKAFGYNESLLWQHYQQYGIKEGRKAYAKGATAPATTTVAAPVAPAANSDFLSREGGIQIQHYAYSIGLISGYGPPQQLAPGHYSTSFIFRKEGWSARCFAFTLHPGNSFWSCTALSQPAAVSGDYVLGRANAYSLEDVKAFINRFKK